MTFSSAKLGFSFSMSIKCRSGDEQKFMKCLLYSAAVCKLLSKHFARPSPLRNAVFKVCFCQTHTHSSSTILVALVASIINQKLNIWGKASPYYVVGILQFNKYGFAMFVFLNELWAVCTQKSAKKSQCCTSFWRKRRTTHHPQIYTRHQQRFYSHLHLEHVSRLW